MRVAICQMTSTDNLAINFQRVCQTLDDLRTESADLISFPENALYFRLGGEIPALRLTHSLFTELAQKSSQLGSVIHLGGVALIDESGFISNASIWIEPNGSISSVYKKMHLFDVQLRNGESVRESDHFTCGENLYISHLKQWKIGHAICYDLRFPYLFDRYIEAGVDIVLVPSSFLRPTGQAHWEILLRARAIEGQYYVLAAAQGGSHTSTQGYVSKKTFGHSLAVDPWGVILDQIDAEDKRSYFLIECDRKSLDSTQSQIPVRHHRRRIWK